MWNVVTVLSQSRIQNRKDKEGAFDCLSSDAFLKTRSVALRTKSDISPLKDLTESQPKVEGVCQPHTLGFFLAFRCCFIFCILLPFFCIFAPFFIAEFPIFIFEFHICF